MNANCYKVIFSKRHGALIAVGEHTTSAGKAASGQGCRGGMRSGASDFVGTLKLLAATVIFSSLSTSFAQSTLSTTALPTGASINAGNASVSTSGAAMTISQTSNKASINWQSFNIGSAASVNIAQPNASSVLLNRVVGNDPSQILGKLSANGQVILLNPNGIVFGKDGSVTASSFTASTFALNDADFMAGFYKYSRNGSTAAVVNQGNIEVTAGGFVALIGATVTNEGLIHAPQGDVVLAAAETVTLPQELIKPQAPTTPNTVSVRMSKRVRLELDPAAINTAVNNTESGVIVTEGGQVLLQAAALSTAVASVTHSGHIDTSAAQAGAVTLLAENGHIKVSGSITANSNGNDGQGQANKGGNIIIGRDEDTGALAANTDVSGAQLQSKGGFVETSGEWLATTGTRVKAKDWLLDPANITITSTSSGTAYSDPNGTGGSYGYTATATSNILASDIQASLNDGTNVTISTGLAGSTGADAGNITVASNINKSSGGAATLKLEANNKITFNNGIKISDSGSGNLGVHLVANGASGSGNSVVMNANSAIDVGGNVVFDVASSAGGGLNNSAIYMILGSLNQAENNGGSRTLIRGANVTINNSLSGNNTWGLFAQHAAGIEATNGDINITATYTGAGSTSGTAVFMGSSWNGVSAPASNYLKAANGGINVESIITGTTADGKLNFAGTTISAKNDINLKAKVTTATINAIGISAEFNNPKIQSTSGNVLIQANQGGVSIGSLTAGAISGNNVTIDNTGSTLVRDANGNFTKGSGSYTGTTGTAVAISGSATGIQASGNLDVIGVGSVAGSTGVTQSANIQGSRVSIQGQNVGTGTGSTNGFYNTGTITSTGSDVYIRGVSQKDNALSLQGAITGKTDVSLLATSGDSSNTASSWGLYLNKAVTAQTGNISVSATSTSNSVASAYLNTGASLITSAASKTITVSADTLQIDTSATPASINAGSTGTVNIRPVTSGVGIDIGGNDVMTSGSNVLGLTSAELARVTAGQLNIGNSTAGNMTVSASTTIAATSGHVSVTTGGNIGLNAALTIGDAGATKNLTFNGAGATSAITQSAAIKAAGLELLGANATYTLTNTGNDIKKLAGNTKTVSLVNNAAFAIDTVNTVGLTASSKTTLNSTAAVTQTQALTTPSLELLGTGGSYTLTNTSNAVTTLAANTGGVNFVDASALSIGTVNATNGITSTSDVTLKTLTGNLTLSNDITTTGTVNLDAAGAIARTAGTINATTLNLKAGSTIGTSGSHVQTNVTNLSLDAADSEYITEADAVSVSARTTANNGNIDITTTNGTLTVASVNAIAGVSANGTGTVTLSGNTTSGSGVYLGNNVTSTSGNIVINGTTSSTTNFDAGVKSNNSATISGHNITMVASATGTSGSVLGYYGAGATFNASGQLSLTGTTAAAGNGFYSYTGSFTSGTGMSLSGTSASGQAVGLDNGITLTNGSSGGISITGTATTTSNEAIGLRGTTISNSGGNIAITALSGGIVSTSGNLAWGSGVLNNTITNAVGGGAVQLSAGNGSSTSSAAVDGSVLTLTQNSNAGVTISSSGTGNVTSPKIINNGTGNVVIAAGSAIAAGTGTGGQVLTVAGNSITQGNVTPGKTYVYSGQASATGVLTNLSSAYSTLYYEGTSHAVNTGFNTAYDGTPANDLTAPAGGSVSANAQVFFRSTTKPGFTLALNDLSKQYGDTDPTAFVATSGAAWLNNSYAGVGGTNSFAVATADVIASLTGTRAAGENVGAYAYTLDGSSMNTTLAAQPHLNITQRDITVTSITAASKQYDGGTTATINGGVFGNLVNGETLSLSGSGVFANANAANGKVVDVADVTTLGKVDGTGLWSNYNLTTTGAVSGSGNITKAPLTLTVNNSSVFVTQLASSAPDNGFSYSGFLNGDTSAVFNSMPTRTYTGAASYPVAGTYNGVLGTSAVPTSTNYLVTVVPGNLTITPADKLLITIGSQTSAYGNQTAAAAGTAATGTVTAQYCFDQTNCNGVNLVDLALTRLSASQWKAADNTGSYVVFDTSVTGAQASSSGYLKAGNYTYTASEIVPLSLPNGNFTGRATNAGTLTITPLAVSLASTTVTKPYDGTTALPASVQPTNTLTVSNAITGDTVDAAFTSGAFTSSAASSTAGFQLLGVQLSGADATNYALTNYANSTYTGTGSITGGSNGSNSGGNKKPFVIPKPILPTHNTSGDSSEGSSEGNPYLVLPKADNTTDRCNANNLEACLCEDQPNEAVDNLAICYQPKTTAKIQSHPPRQNKG